MDTFYYYNKIFNKWNPFIYKYDEHHHKAIA